MSMDLAVWSEREFDLPRQLPSAEQWKLHGDEWSFEGQGWQILVLPAREQPDSAVTARLPQAKFVGYVTLEPIGSDRSAYGFLEEVVRSLAKAISGVWIDPDGNAHRHGDGVFE